MVDHADGAGAADGRRILHHGEQLRLTVVRKGVADGHRHHVVHVLLHTINLNDFFYNMQTKSMDTI